MRATGITVGGCPESFASHARPGLATPARSAGDDYGETAEPELARGRLGGAPAQRTPSAGTRSTTSTSCPRTPRRTTARRWSSSTASAASGRTGSRTCRARRSSGARSRSTCPASGSPPCPRERITDLRLRPDGGGALRRPRARPRGAGRQLDGRLHRRRGGDPLPAAGGAARARVGRGHHDSDLVPRPGARRSAAPPRRSRRTPRPATASSRAGRSRGTWRWRSWRATRAGWRRTSPTRRFIKGAGKPGFNDALRACLEYDFRERLPEIACPTLIVWGENDAILPAADADEFERLIPDAASC